MKVGTMTWLAVVVISCIEEPEPAEELPTFGYEDVVDLYNTFLIF